MRYFILIFNFLFLSFRSSNIEEDCPSDLIDLTLHCVQYRPENRPSNQVILDTLRKIQKDLEEKK